MDWMREDQRLSQSARIRVGFSLHLWCSFSPFYLFLKAGWTSYGFKTFLSFSQKRDGWGRFMNKLKQKKRNKRGLPWFTFDSRNEEEVWKQMLPSSMDWIRKWPFLSFLFPSISIAQNLHSLPRSVPLNQRLWSRERKENPVKNEDGIEKLILDINMCRR